jgi:hypothetical protein
MTPPLEEGAVTESNHLNDAAPSQERTSLAVGRFRTSPDRWLAVVPAISLRLLYGPLILRHSRRELLRLGVTAHPTAECIARQLTEACGRTEPPRRVIRDRDGAYGEAFIRRLARMGILIGRFG